ncbi:hypothetical protein C0993_002705 [Termitomyces sp. T159_Od127]|nr:hypothetical protein C0993_002705 [Termitomyces sp. T159_Od127]
MVVVHDKKNVVHIMEDVIYEVLEGGGEVGHIKGHHKVLEEAVVGAEGGFPFMFQGYADIVIAGAEVDLGVDAEAVNKVIDEGKKLSFILANKTGALVVEIEGQMKLLPSMLLR